jgi:hypothetical protein
VEAADNTDFSAGVPDRVTAEDVTCVTQRGRAGGTVASVPPDCQTARLYWAHGSDSLAGRPGPAAHPRHLACREPQSLLSPGWYVNWTDGDESTIVFPGTVFRYRRGDLQARAAAQEHGRQCGVPEAQLDWTD